MNIIGRISMALAGALFAAGVAVVGCGTTNNLDSGSGTSDLGESCTRTFDCKSGLVCEQNTCFKPTATTSPDAGSADGGDASVAVTGPHLGELNESCQTSSDCEAPLDCIGLRCNVVAYGLTPTGKSCTGECNVAADCCELPVNGAGLSGFLGGWEAPVVDGGVPVFHSEISTAGVRCQDLLAFIGGDPTICAGAASFTQQEEGLGQGCFLYDTYCASPGACGAGGPWACSNNQCVYTAPCTAQGTVATSTTTCPSATRAGRALSSTCNVPASATTGTCSAGCTMDADCAGKVPSGAAHACSTADGGATDCTCYQSACYFACAGDLDCASGSTCNTTTHLCQSSGCAADSDCVQSLGNAQAKCVMNACSIACSKDTDCSPPSTVCSAGYCKASGCTTDSDCSSGGAHVFCVTPASPTTFTGAITN